MMSILRDENGEVVSIFITGTIGLDPDDGGQALVGEVGVEDTFFVRLQSWDETKKHELIRELDHQLVRVTVEVLR